MSLVDAFRAGRGEEMAVCAECGTSQLFMSWTEVALCGPCARATRERVAGETKRLQDALLFAETMVNPRDQERYLQRANESLRKLVAYERLGLGPEHLDVGREREALAAQMRALREREAGTADRREVVVGASTADGLASASASPSYEKQRSTPRKAKALPVRLGKGRTRALAIDISADGLCIHSPVTQIPGSTVDVLLGTAQGPVAAKGIVRWARPAGREDLRTGPTMLGIEFVLSPWTTQGSPPPRVSGAPVEGMMPG